MADRSVDYLFVGGGVAAGRAARTLREEGADGSALLVTREPDPPYSRPPLSKAYLAGKEGREDAYVRPPDWYEENGVELLTGTSVMKLDLGERVAKLSTREEVSFGKALIATGANVRRLRVDGCELDGIHYLRTFANSDAIRAESEDVDRVVLIGGSFIACEVAATLTSLGRRCSLVCQEEATLERQFGKTIGGFFQGVLEEHGIDVHGGDDLERYEGADGRVGRVVTKGGLELDCGMVVVGAGVIPDTTLAKAAGLELGEAGGVRCSDRLQTAVEGVYVAGDIAEYDSPLHGRPVRIEHWDVAFEQGKTAGRNLAGADTPHDAIPYFWSDLADWTGLEYLSAGATEGDPVIRGSLADGSFTAFWLADDGRLAAALTVGRSDDLDHARRMIQDRTAPDAAALADESTDLAEL
jgi:3-phenylpropionate/trans-cinnamate dioxygenase ferredoxin reductase component